MRYLIFLFVLAVLSNSVYAGVPNCANNPQLNSYQWATGLASMTNCRNAGGYVVNYSQYDCSSPSYQGNCIIYACGSNCTCPSGQKLNTVDGKTDCIPEDQCPAGQVYFEGFCREPESSPDECGSTYTTAVEVQGGGYMCTNNETCPEGTSGSIFTNANGSWTVCSPSGQSNSSSGDASSSGQNSSADSGGGSSSGSDSSSGNGDGGGGDGGDGGGDGGNGGSNNSGSSSSAGGNPSSSGSNSSSGDGVGLTDCNQQPVCTDGSPECAILYQQWHARCGGDFDGDIFELPDDAEGEGFGDALGEFGERMQSGSNMQHIKDFFAFNASGSCPVWNVNVWVFNIVIDQLCSPIIPWDIISGVLLAVSCFFAARIALT